MIFYRSVSRPRAIGYMLWIDSYREPVAPNHMRVSSCTSWWTDAAVKFFNRCSSQGQHLAAGLPRIPLLRNPLLRSGVEQNPGLETYFCYVCQRRLHPNSTSVQQLWSLMQSVPCVSQKIYRNLTSVRCDSCLSGAPHHSCIDKWLPRSLL